MNIKSLCLVGTLFVSVGMASDLPDELSPREQNINSATNNLFTSQVQVDPQQKTEQIQNSQTTLNTNAQNGATEQQNDIEEFTNFMESYMALLSSPVDNDQQNTYYYNTEQAMYDMMNEWQYTQGWDIYSPAWQYWDPWQDWCPNCAYFFYGTPER